MTTKLPAGILKSAKVVVCGKRLLTTDYKQRKAKSEIM